MRQGGTMPPKVDCAKRPPADARRRWMLFGLGLLLSCLAVKLVVDAFFLSAGPHLVAAPS